MFSSRFCDLSWEAAQPPVVSLHVSNVAPKKKWFNDEILKPLHMEFSEFVEAEVPKKSKIVGMRRNERLKLLKENQLFWERNF